MNLVIIHGRLAKDPETKTTQSGKTFARFTVAVDRQTKEKSADFIPCTAWGQTADLIAKYFMKGKEIMLQGRIQTGSYTDQNGNKRYTTDVIVDRIEFCGSKGTSAAETTEVPF